MPTQTADTHKMLRSLCATRHLRIDSARLADGSASVIIAGEGWEFVKAGHPLTVYVRAHAAVLAKYPRRGGQGGANSTREKRAQKAARVAEEQWVARCG